MKRILLASGVAVTLFLVGCSSKSAEEKAAEEALTQLQEVLGSINPSETVEVDEETAREWPEKFCSLEVGMTREQVKSVMGVPTREFRDQNANQDQYEAWGYSLTIFYDIDDIASQIQPNSDNVPCETKFSN